MRYLMTLVLCALAACQPASIEQHATTTGPDVEAVTGALEQYIAAVNAGDMESALALIAGDAINMPPDGPPIVGIAAIRSNAEDFFPYYTMQSRTTPDEVVVSGDLALVRASYTDVVTPRDGGETTEASGVWLIVMRRQPDGSWKMWRDMWSVIPAQAADPM